jgi:GNAT superfamily N-acetyltransferase
MSAVAGVTGGHTFHGDAASYVWQPRPHRELLVAFPRDMPGHEVLERATALGARRVGCWAAGPWPELDVHLRGLGFEPGWKPHWMEWPTRPAEPDPRVAEVDDVPEYDDYGQALLALTRQRPQTSFLFVAREEGRFAGHAWLHVAAHIGGLFDVFVIEDLRRRGLGSALTRAASAKAAALGIDWIALNAEGTGEPLYSALGFRSRGYGQTWWLHPA